MVARPPQPEIRPGPSPGRRRSGVTASYARGRPVRREKEDLQMKSKMFLLVKAVISIVIAFLMLFFAVTFLNWFLKTGVPAAAQLGPMSGLRDLIRLMSGYFGAMLLGVGLICFFASSVPVSALRKNVILGLFVADAIGFVLALIAQFSGKFSGRGWLLVALWLVLALFLAYFYFLKPED
jgi:hypothetical protein